MFQTSTAHRQEVRYVYVANGNSKMTVGGPGWNGPLTVILEVPFAIHIHLTC
jgi:hypothetical protein